MKKIRKRLWVGGYLVGTIGVLVLYALGVSGGIAYDDPGGFFAFTFFATAPAIFAPIFGLVILYRMWAVIRYIGGRAAPWQAVVFMFIPLYAWYWVFQAYWGWTKDYNRAIKEGNIKAPHMSKGLALTASTLWVVSSVLSTIGYFMARNSSANALPVLVTGLLIYPIHMVLMIVFYAKACNGINTMVYALEESKKVSTT